MRPEHYEGSYVDGLLRDNARLRAWMTYWRYRLKDGHRVEDMELHRASIGDAPPRKRARKVKR